MKLVLLQLEHQVKEHHVSGDVLTDLHRHIEQLQHINRMNSQQVPAGFHAEDLSSSPAALISLSSLNGATSATSLSLPRAPTAPQAPYCDAEETTELPPEDFLGIEITATAAFRAVSTTDAFDDENRVRVVQIFRHVDTKNSGTVSRAALASMLQSLHIPSTRWMKLLSAADEAGSGSVHEHQWAQAVQHSVSPSDLDAIARAAKKRLSLASISEEDRTQNPWFMLRPQSRARICWDLSIMVVLFYLMLAMPFQTAFEEGLETSEVKTMNDIDMGITCLFVLDILLNFRTGYLQNYIEILDTRRVAMRYLRTWAPLDIISTMPFEQMMGSGEQLAAIRVFKIGKLFRVFKIIALSARAASSLGESLDEFSAEYKLTSIRRRWGVLSVLFISAHWLACGLKLFGSPGLTGYQDVAGSGWREYLAGLYWAITTLTTVGYGDITPNSDGGRLYCMVSMVLGGAFYGYIVGSISSIVANRDLNSNHYDECMDLSNAWMTHHKFPRPLRVKVRRYFKEYFAEQCAHDDSEAYGQLSTALQDEVCEYLFAEDLRAHPMFDGVSSSVIMQMNKIMHKFKVQEGELITKAGDPGLAMYVILDGTVTLEHSEGDGKKMLRTKGDSFDEEILFGLAEWCTSTAIAASDSEIQMITEDGFTDCFKSMPEVVDVLRENMLRFNERRQHTFE